MLSNDSQESAPAPQFESINSLVLSFLYGPTLMSVGFLDSSIGKESSSNVGGLGLITFIFLNCRGPALVDPGKFEGETALANTLALIKY